MTSAKEEEKKEKSEATWAPAACAKHTLSFDLAMNLNGEPRWWARMSAKMMPAKESPGKKYRPGFDHKPVPSRNLGRLSLPCATFAGDDEALILAVSHLWSKRHKSHKSQAQKASDPLPPLPPPTKNKIKLFDKKRGAWLFVLLSRILGGQLSKETASPLQPGCQCPVGSVSDGVGVRSQRANVLPSIFGALRGTIQPRKDCGVSKEMFNVSSRKS